MVVTRRAGAPGRRGRRRRSHLLPTPAALDRMTTKVGFGRRCVVLLGRDQAAEGVPVAPGGAEAAVGIVLFGLTGGAGIRQEHSGGLIFRARGFGHRRRRARPRGGGEGYRGASTRWCAPWARRWSRRTARSIARAVAAVVFADPDKRRQAERDRAPAHHGAHAEARRRAQAQGEPLACYEAALLVENTGRRCVPPARRGRCCPEAVQIARAMGAGRRDRTPRARPARRAAPARQQGRRWPTTSSRTPGDRAATERQADEVRRLDPGEARRRSQRRAPKSGQDPDAASAGSLT